MKCATHHDDATAVCAYCGRALCPACERVASSARTACSTTCAEALAKSDQAIDLMLSKSIQMLKTTAYGCYLLGALFIVFAFWGHHVYPAMRLGPPLMAVMGAGIVLWGFWYQRVGSKK
jgi:hypothetical protein